MSYHAEVRASYASTLAALRAEGLATELIDTGGGCKAIDVTGIVAGDQARTLGGAYILLTAGGPLMPERGTAAWEVGLYDGENEPGVVMTSIYTEKPQDDRPLAQEVAYLARLLAR